MTTNRVSTITGEGPRSSYDAQAEREAELVATIILDWASVMERVSHRPASNPSVQRIQTALGDRRGWL